MDVAEFLVIFLGLTLLLAIAMASGAFAPGVPAGPSLPAWRLPAAPAPPLGWGQQPPAYEQLLIPQVLPAPIGRPDPTSEIPPMFLYHGTAVQNLDNIAARGIEGRTGGWAFMATDYDTASGYARSRGHGPGIVFRIRAQQAYQNGVRFEKRHGTYFVAPSIHPGHIDFHWSLVDHVGRLRGQPVGV